MQVRCIRDFGHHKPGDTAEVPDGAAFDREHYEPVSPPPTPAPPVASAVTPAAAVTPKEGM